MTKRSFLILCLPLILLMMAACSPTPTADRADVAPRNAGKIIEVHRSPTCGCCEDWIAHLENHGYDTRVKNSQNMSAVKSQHHVPSSLQSCHTAVINGYVIEGHVPVAEIERLLAEQPDITGLAVPGMPLGSPGMDSPGAGTQPYDVIAFDEAGNATVFAGYTQ